MFLFIMKILIFADMHGNKKALKEIISRAKKEDIELVVNAGDFTIFGDEQDQAKIYEIFVYLLHLLQLGKIKYQKETNTLYV